MAIVEWRPSKEGQLQWMRTMQRMLSVDAVEGDADKEECRWVRVIDASEAVQQRKKCVEWSLRVRRGGSFTFTCVVFAKDVICAGGCRVSLSSCLYNLQQRRNEAGGGEAGGAVIHHLPYL
jgi:hypothetical protein